MTAVIEILQALFKLSPSELAAGAFAIIALYHYFKARILEHSLTAVKTELFQTRIGIEQSKTDASLAQQEQAVKQATEEYEKALKNSNLK